MTDRHDAKTGSKGSNVSEAEGLRAQILDLTERYWALAHGKKPFVPGRSPVAVSGRVGDKSDLRSLVESSLDFWLTAGRFNDAFEKRLGEYLGLRNVLTVNSGSSANLVAFSAFTSEMFGDRALKAGDEVLTCATGFPTTVNPAVLYGLVPVFVDVSIPTYNVDVSKLEGAIGPKTRAIMIAHTLGNPFDVGAVMEIARRHDLIVIEDCCDALGARYDGKLVGTFGDAGTLSFYPAHHITMGEGGAVFTKSAKVRRAMESIRDWGRDCYCAPGKDNTCGKRFEWKLGDLPKGYDHKYTYSHLGFNLKITDMQAAVGLSQLARLDQFVAARRGNFAALRRGLLPLEELFILPEPTPRSEPSWFGFPLTVRAGAPFSRDDLVRRLNERGIATRLLFGGNLLRQPYMRGRAHRVAGSLDQANIVVDRTFWVGVYPGLGAEEVGYMIGTFHALCEDAGWRRPV